MPISAFAPKSGHTPCYIRKQITIDISWDIPTFHRPIIGTQIVTLLGISQHCGLQPRWTFLLHPIFPPASFKYRTQGKIPFQYCWLLDKMPLHLREFFIVLRLYRHHRLVLNLPHLYLSPLCCNFEGLNKPSACMMGKVQFEFQKHPLFLIFS